MFSDTSKQNFSVLNRVVRVMNDKERVEFQNREQERIVRMIDEARQRLNRRS